MDVPEEVEFLERILEVLQDAPWLVYEEEGKVLGYAYASEHRKRKAYKWTREVSVYLDPSCQGRGVATRLYNVLFDILKRQGFINLLAGVTLPNTSSVSLHRKMGFEPIGTYHKVGYKRGQFWDVAWFEKLISDSKPSTPKTLADLGYKPGQFI